MKKILIIVLVSIVLKSSVNAQSAFFELGGPGLASFNYDTRFGHKQDGFGGRIGIGGFSVDREGVVFIPIGINYLTGKDGKNYFEIGGGVTPLIASGGFTNDGSKFTTTFGHVLFGYRMQPPNGGFTFRAFVCPVFGSGFFVPYYGGISFGYKFGEAKGK